MILPQSPFYEITQTGSGEMVIHMSGRMDADTSTSILEKLHAEIKSRQPSSLTIDLDQVTYLDDFGALILYEIKQEVTAQNGEFSLIRVRDSIQQILSLVDFDSQQRFSLAHRKKSSNVVLRLGRETLQQAYHFRFLISFLGSVILSLLHACRHPKSLRTSDVIQFMEKTGVDALPIVGLISFLLGLVMAFTSSMQLQQFGANIYVASLVAIAMVSELGPIMTAIIVAGRSGSAFAAEIASMKISEEIDALLAMGFSPTLFLAVPRLIASVIVVAILNFFSDIFAISGGLVVGVFMLNLTPQSYIRQTIETLTLFEVMWGVMKSVFFAVAIAWIGCLRGFQAKGGASAVGNAATSAVVSSIFLIILFDSIFAVIRSYW